MARLLLALTVLLAACSVFSAEVVGSSSGNSNLGLQRRRRKDGATLVAGTSAAQNDNKSKLQRATSKDGVTLIAAATKAATKTASVPSAAYACILGGALAHLVLGTLYCWGNFLSYAPLSLRFFDGKERPGAAFDAIYIIPLTLMAQAAAMPFGPGLVAKFGPKTVLLFGTLLTAASVFAASMQTNLSMFMLFYSIVFGTGVGLAYTAPMIAGWKYLPNAKGLVSGGILTGFGAGGFIFNKIGTKLVNPKGLNPVNGKFPQEVYDNFPKMLRTLSLIYAATAVVGASLISEPSAASVATQKKSGASKAPPALPGVTVSEALKTQQYWMMWMMIISSASASLNVASVYKSFAGSSKALSGDAFQATIGGVGALFNGFGRLIWGLIADKIGFKRSFVALTLMQGVLMATYSFTTASKTLYAANTCLLFFCLAGNLALMPSAAQKMFGPRAGATIYGVMFSAFGIASVFGSWLTKTLTESYGWSGTFNVLSALSFLATAIVTCLVPLKGLPSSSV